MMLEGTKGASLNFGRVTLQVNYGCNQRCLHCFQSAGPDLIARDREGSRDFVPIIRRLREFGFKELKVLGGEPLLYSALEELMLVAQSLGFRSSIVTGGSTGSANKWRQLADRVEEIWFSVYHLDKSVHDDLVQLPGALDILWRNLSIVADRTTAGAHLLISKRSIREVPRIVAGLCAKGILKIKILRPTPQGAALRNWAEYDISFEEWERLRQDIFLLKEEFKDVRLAIAHQALEGSAEIELSNTAVCSYGDRKLWGVNPEGLLYPCCLLMEDASYALGHVLQLTPTLLAERLTSRIKLDSMRGVGPLSGEGACPALLGAEGDRRAKRGWRLMCPLNQVQIR